MVWVSRPLPSARQGNTIVQPQQDTPMLTRTLSTSAILLGAGLGLILQSPGTCGQDAKRDRTREAAIMYQIVQQGQEEPVWKVTITGTGLAGVTKPVRLRLENWGEWQDVDDYYLRSLTAKPPLKRNPNKAGEFVLEAPVGWDGAFEVSYTIPLARVGSKAHQRHGLLPCWNEHAACAFSINTLMHVDAGDLPVHRTARIVPPAGLYVASGWGGITQGEQQAPILGPATEMDNAPILIGTPTSRRAEKHGEVLYEAAQFGAGGDRSAELLHVAKSVIPLYTRHSGYTSGQPVRIFLFQGTPGATNTRSAFVASYRPAGTSLTASFKHLIAHELFHRWLGTDFVLGNDAIAWFHEGFTDYLSLWTCAASGVLDRGYFASRMKAIDSEARRSPVYGKVAFAQEGVSWRGAQEKYAYRGGAVLAFLMDVELRKQGRPGVMQMIVDFGTRKQKEPIRLADIRDWMRQHGMEALYQTCVEGKELPPIDSALAAIGFIPKDVPADLTYFGIRVDKDRIVELDPDGPAAKAGFRVDDRIIGRYPGWRSEQVRVSEKVTTKYRYGLEFIEPAVAGTFLDVVRGKEELTIRVQPRLMEGGLASRYEADEAKLRAFFAFRLEKP
jgi:hypothetical protein